jgi:hypothetical protein
VIFPTSRAVVLGVFALLLTIPLASGRIAAPARMEELIVSDYQVLPGDRTYERVTITEGGVLDTGFHELTITGSGGLTCDGVLLINGYVVISGGGDSTVTGTIELNSPTAGISLTQQSCSLLGGGTLLGRWSNFVFVDRGTNFNSGLTITGSVVFAADGSSGTAGFHNGSTVLADGGSILIRSGFTVTDTAASLWKTIHAGSLRFNSPAIALSGSFAVHSGAVLNLNESITTTGMLESSFGWITVAFGETFIYGGLDCLGSDLQPFPIVGPVLLSLICL